MSSQATSRTWPERILYFTHRSCWPHDTGAKLRNWYLAHALARRSKVTFLAFEDDHTAYESAESKRAKAEFAEPLERVVSVTPAKRYTPDRVLKSFVGKLPIPVLNYTTDEMKSVVARLCDEMSFDAVQVEGIHLGAYLPILHKTRSRPVLVCDWHNIESEVQRRFSENTPSRPRSLIAKYLAMRLATYESSFIREFDAHVAVSERDREGLLAIDPRARAFAVDNGVDVTFFDAVAANAKRWIGEFQAGKKDSRPRRLVFVGSMDYHANVDAARELANHAWPKIHAAHPDWTFAIVGRAPTAEVRALGRIPGVEVVGAVEDVRPSYEAALMAVVPLRIGGGSRLKILEAMAAGVPVVSTKLGAEGIPATDGEQILIANDVPSMVEPILRLADDADLLARLSENGRKLVLDRYDWRAVGETLLGVYDALHASRRPAAPR